MTENITLAKYQQRAIGNLLEAMESEKCEIVLKSCTGSGKTIILTRFIDEYLKSNPKTVFIWLTPGNGELEEQSKEKMDRYIHGSSTKLLSDVMRGGFEENDVCFINWELVTNKKNNALKDSERTNFKEYIEKALDGGLNFKVIIDESHTHNTVKANDVIQYFKTDKIIKCSATPIGYNNAYLVDIPEGDVIDEGLIKKLIIINEGFEHNIHTDDQIEYLIGKALEKQTELRNEFMKVGSDVNPLILIQLPNTSGNDNSDIILDKVEQHLKEKGINYENHQLSVWLDMIKKNEEGITENNAEQTVLIMKQAVSTGWDCPRAHILVKLRDNMSDTFEIQTFGRIRRMPEAHHYENDLLDCCYIYTFDSEFVEGVKQSVGNGALDAKKIFLKPEYKTFSLPKEQKNVREISRDSYDAIHAIMKYFEKTYGTDTKTIENKTKLERGGYVFNINIVDTTKTGELAVVESRTLERLSDVNILETLNTHTHGREFHHTVNEIGRKLNIDSDSMKKIIRRLFARSGNYDSKILSLEPRSLYAFVLNNREKLKYDIRQSMAAVLEQSLLDLTFAPKEIPFTIPQTCIFTYNGKEITQEEYDKNVYKGYISSAEPRSHPERLFEIHCETSENVKWYYKNGDKGVEYFSIIIKDSFGKEKGFYPDYIVCDKNDDIWIVETKGGFSDYGQSKDIDDFTERKFEYLKRYLQKHNLKGGVAVDYKERMYICTEKYDDKLSKENWKPLKEVL